MIMTENEPFSESGLLSTSGSLRSSSIHYQVDVNSFEFFKSSSSNSSSTSLSNSEQNQQQQQQKHLINSHPSRQTSQNEEMNSRLASSNEKLAGAEQPTCALCNCADKHSLGQGDLLRFDARPDAATGLLLGALRRAGAEPGFRHNDKFVVDCLVGYLETTTTSSAAAGDGDYLAQYVNKNPNLVGIFKTLAAQSASVLKEHIRRLQIPAVILEDLDKVGWNLESGAFKPNLLIGSRVYAHSNCLSWSSNAQRTPDASDFTNVDQLACESLTRKCSLCNRYGASVKCVEAGCDQVFHYPCAIISGCYQDSANNKILCAQHLDQATRHFDQSTMACCLCDASDRLSEQLLCTSCGLHFHSDCLSSIDTNATWNATGNNMLVRMGWQCPECKLCQSCLKSGDDTKTLVCDTCDKCYHIFCLRPEFVSSSSASGSGGGGAQSSSSSSSSSTSPNNGWKCPRCKLCQSCDKRLIKSLAAEAGQPLLHEQILMLNLASNLCNECYKLKCSHCSNDSNLNDLSRRLIRSCSSCKNYYHASCDTGSDLKTRANAAAAAATYTCTYCINKSAMNSISKQEHPPMPAVATHATLLAEKLSQEGNRKRSVKDLLELAQSNYLPVAAETTTTVKRESLDVKEELMDSSSNQSSSSLSNSASGGSGSGSGSSSAKPAINSKKKQISKKTTNKNIKRQTSTNSNGGGGGSRRSTRNNSNNAAGGGAGGANGKDLRGGSGQSAGGAGGGKGGNGESSASPRPGSASAEMDEPTIGHIKRDEEDHHAVTVILALDDSISQRQDMCLNCGSFGKGDDGQTMSCSQCGQCYHTYCAGINSVCDVMREKGWRCLDCTVCEGCGKATDESRLLLCDDCDISYHIYCLNPPLEHVPKGSWKCKWCVRCAVCGTKSQAKSSFEWKNNYTECALCNSLHTCHVCNAGYTEADIVLKCLGCERWSHYSCSVSTNSAHHHPTHHQLISEDEAERIAKRGFSCSKCVQETGSGAAAAAQQAAATAELSLKKQLENENLMPFIDKLNRLMAAAASSAAGATKRGALSAQQQALEDGVYLTEAGNELIKQLKIKPAPANPTRRSRARLNAAAPAAAAQPMEVDLMPLAALDEDASRSSNEDGTKKAAVAAGPPGSQVATAAAAAAAAAAKRHISVGIGGFNPKARNRTTNKQAEGGDSGQAKRAGRKKLACEEMMPQYIQEAFFGMSILNKCKEDGGAFSLEDRKFLPPSEYYDSFSDSNEDSDDESAAGNDENAMMTDENSSDFKVKAKVKARQKEGAPATAATTTTGAEQELKRQKSRNQMLSRRNSTVNRYHFTSHATCLDSDNTIKLSKHNKNDANLELGIDDLLDGDIVSYLFSENRNLMEFHGNDAQDPPPPPPPVHQAPPAQQQVSAGLPARSEASAHHPHSSHPAEMKGQAAPPPRASSAVFIDDSTSRNKLYDDLFSNIDNINPTVGHHHHHHHHHLGATVVGTGAGAEPAHVAESGRQMMMLGGGSGMSSDSKNIDDLARQFKESTHKYASQTSQTSVASSPGPAILFQPQQPQQQQQAPPPVARYDPMGVYMAPQQQQQQQQMQQADRGMVPQPQQQQQQQHMMTSMAPQQMLQPQSITVSLINDEQQMQKMAASESTESAAGSDAANKAAEDALKQKKLLEKYLEDEELGEFATQAMPLYTNLHHPGLKQEFPDPAERYKQVMKLWRKLDDAALKTQLVNKSRQNRTHKRKTDTEGDSASNQGGLAGAGSSSTASGSSSAAPSTAAASATATVTSGVKSKKSKMSDAAAATVSELSNDQNFHSLPSSRSQTPHSSLNNTGNTVASILESNDAANRLMMSQQQQQQQALVQGDGMQRQAYISHGPGGQQIVHLQAQQQQHPQQQQQMPPQQQQQPNNPVYFYQVRPQQAQMQQQQPQQMAPTGQMSANWQQQQQYQTVNALPQQQQIHMQQQQQRPPTMQLSAMSGAGGQYYVANAPTPVMQSQPQQISGYQIVQNQQQHPQQQQQQQMGGHLAMMPGGQTQQGGWNGAMLGEQQKQQPMRVYLTQVQGAGGVNMIEVQQQQQQQGQGQQTSEMAGQPVLLQRHPSSSQEAAVKPLQDAHSFANRFPSAASSGQTPLQQNKPAGGENKDVSDHIDSIIDAVACGSGTIPYGDSMSNFGGEDDDDFFENSNDPKDQSDSENGLGDDDDDDNGSNSLKQYNTLKFINEKASEFFSTNQGHNHEQDALTLSTSSLTIPANIDVSLPRKSSPSSSSSHSSANSHPAAAVTSTAPPASTGPETGDKPVKVKGKPGRKAKNPAAAAAAGAANPDGAESGEKTVKRRKKAADGQPPKPRASKATKINQHPQMQIPPQQQQQQQHIQVPSSLSETAGLIEVQQAALGGQEQAVYFNKPILLEQSGAMISGINPSMFINAGPNNNNGIGGGGTMTVSAAASNIVFCKDSDSVKKMISLNECNIFTAASQPGVGGPGQSTIIYQHQLTSAGAPNNNGGKPSNVLLRSDCLTMASGMGDPSSMPTLTQIQMFNNGANNGQKSQTQSNAEKIEKFLQLDGQLDNEDDEAPPGQPANATSTGDVVKPASFVVIQAAAPGEVKVAPMTNGGTVGNHGNAGGGGQQQPSQQAVPVQIMPTFNGDNALLKALLQSAPKNAPAPAGFSANSSSAPTPAAAASEKASTPPAMPIQDVENAQAKDEPAKTISEPAAPSLVMAEVKVEASDKNLSDSIEAAISKAQSELGTDSKDFLADSTTPSSVSAAQPAAAAAPPKQRKKANPANRKKTTIAAVTNAMSAAAAASGCGSAMTIGAMTMPHGVSSSSSSLSPAVASATAPAAPVYSDQDAAVRIFEYLKSTLNHVNSNSSSVQHLRMSQPKQPIVGSIRQHQFINYPGRMHSVMMGKSIGRLNEERGFFHLEIEPIKPDALSAQQSSSKMLMHDNKKFVDFIINEPHSSSKEQPTAATTTGDKEAKKGGAAVVETGPISAAAKAQLVNYFRIASGGVCVTPADVPVGGINDSKERLNDLLNLDDESIAQIETSIAAALAKHESADALSSSINDAISNAMASAAERGTSGQSSGSASSNSKSKKIINLINNLDKMKASSAAGNNASGLDDDSHASAKRHPGRPPVLKVNGHENGTESREVGGGEREVINEYLKKKLKPMPRSSSSHAIETMDTREVIVSGLEPTSTSEGENAATAAVPVEPVVKYEAPSPVIGLCSYGEEPMDTEDIQNQPAPDTAQQASSAASGLVKMSIKLDRSAAASIKSTLKQLTNILAVDLPASFELGRFVKPDELKSEQDKYSGLKRFYEQQGELAARKQLEAAAAGRVDDKRLSADEQRTSFISRLLRLSSEPARARVASSDPAVNLPTLLTQFSQSSALSESSVTLQSIVNKYEKSAFKFCKFCESFLNDFINGGVDCSGLTTSDVASLNNKENTDATTTAAGSQETATTATTTSAAPTANEILKFCCTYCQASFQKLLTLRRIVSASVSKQEAAQAAAAAPAPGALKSSSLNSSREDLGVDEAASVPLTSASLINTCLEASICGTSPLANINAAAASTTMLSKRAAGSKRRAGGDIKWFKWNPGLMATVTAHAGTVQQAVSAAAAAQSSSSAKFETLKPVNLVDKRVCCFCHQVGDLEANGPSRLLTMDMGRWCHLNCALWSDEVYETMNGALINVDVAFKKSQAVECVYCRQKGASLKCFAQKCNNNYHLGCALKDKCSFNQDKTIFCTSHAAKATNTIEVLSDLSVFRNVWIQRDEVAQIQSFVSRDIDEDFFAMRIGSLILHSVGQLLPHQLNSSNFHNRNFVYPIGYKATRFYWSVNHCFKRCRYVCSIGENDGLPEFSVSVLEDGVEKETLTDATPSLVWNRLLERLDALRKSNDLVKIFPSYCSGEYLFGLAEPHVIRLIESLPGVETLTNYAFKYGRLQLLDMPLTINPTGCARSEPKLRTHFRSAHKITVANSSAGGTAGGGGASSTPSASSSSSGSSSSGAATTAYYNESEDYEMDEYGNATDQDDYYAKSDDAIGVSYNKQFTLSKSTQYKKLKAEWRSNVYLAKSQIQGLGLYAARDLEKNTMIIEYIGDMIRNEVANTREKLYQTQNRGVYMFRLNDDFVIDATITGGLARYVNHCCDPNCVAETVSVEKEQKIIIIANKRILKGEELTYDYKFDFEDESSKIQCLCGSANCKKWMN